MERSFPADDGLLAGRYRLVAKHASGARGEVFLVQDQETGEDLAVKLLSHLNDSSTVRATEGLLARLRRVHHPGVPRFHQLQSHGSHWFLTMEYIRGRSLEELLNERTRLPPAESARIVARCAEALHALHEQALLHGDIKPANLILDHEGEPHLIDCALEVPSASQGSGQSEVAVGTPHYLAPETVSGSGADLRADLYSLGVVLFRCLTGRLPFVGKDTVELIAAHLADPPVAPSSLIDGVSAGLDEVVLRAMAKDPDDRYQSATELATGIWRAVGMPPTPRRSGRLRPRVLLIESEEGLRGVIHTMLDAAGALVIEASDHLDGMRLAREHTFTAVFVGIEADGEIQADTLIRALKQDGMRRPRVLVVFASPASAFGEEEALAAGADVYMTKPVPVELFRKVLQSLHSESVEPSDLNGS